MSWRPSANTLEIAIDGWRSAVDRVESLVAAGHSVYAISFMSNPYQRVTVLEELEMDTDRLCNTASMLYPAVDQSKFRALLESVKLSTFGDHGPAALFRIQSQRQTAETEIARLRRAIADGIPRNLAAVANNGGMNGELN